MSVRKLSCVVATATLLLTGCGSQVPPDQVFGVGAAGAAQQESVQTTSASNGPSSSGVGETVRYPSPGAALSTSSGAGLPNQSGGGPSGRAPSATSGIRAGSCAGFRNGTNITKSTITVGNVADLTGPVPGLFSSAQQAVMAYAAYFNATSSICGRKIKVIGYDSQTTATGDEQAATSACSDTFALVGSLGAFDSGGASTVAKCGIPDLRAISTTPERVASKVSFGTDSVDPTQVSTSQYRFIKSATGNAYKKTAVLYLNAGAAVPNATAYRKTMESLGYGVPYFQPIDVTAFNYAPYVAKMKSLGITLVQFEGAYQFAVRLKQAMDEQDFRPVFVMDSVAYDPVFVQTGGSDLDGTYSYVDTALFEESARSPEMQVYLSWLHRVAPSARPSFFGMFAWGSMALFTQLAVELGGKLSRSTLLAAIKQVTNYTDHGLFAPQNIGAKRSPACQAVIQLENEKWVRRSAYPYTCSTVFNTAN